MLLNADHKRKLSVDPPSLLRRDKWLRAQSSVRATLLYGVKSRARSNEQPLLDFCRIVRLPSCVQFFQSLNFRGDAIGRYRSTARLVSGSPLHLKTTLKAKK